MMPLPRLVLAADIGTLVGAAFVVITLIGWVINLVNAQAKPARNARPNRPQRPRSERIQSEIEQFMREQGGKREPRGGEREPQRPAPPARPAPPRRVARPLAAPPKTQTPSPPAAPPKKLGANISERSLSGPASLGQSLREHVRTTMTERVRGEAEQYLGNFVDAAVTQHLGTFSGGTPLASPGRTAPASQEILKELRTSEGIRRALIMTEILRRPTARWRRPSR